MHYFLTFHVVKLQLVDRAPGDEAWNASFRANWAAPTNKVSCRLVRSVSGVAAIQQNHAVDAAANSASGAAAAAAANFSASSSVAGSSPPHAISQREKMTGTTSSQMLATTPPLSVDPKTFSAGMSFSTYSSSSSSASAAASVSSGSTNDSLLAVPGVEELLSASPVILMEICRHSAKNACMVECRTTFNLVAMSGTIGDVGNSGATASSSSPNSPLQSGGSRTIIEHALMAPAQQITDSTIFVVATVALTKFSGIVHPNATAMPSQQQQHNLSRPPESILLAPPPPPAPMALDVLSGSVRVSSTDLFVPSLLFSFPDPSAHLVSNVLVVGNATESSQLCVKILSNCSLVRSFPAAGTVIGPRQRAFFSVTFSGWNSTNSSGTQGGNSAASSSAASSVAVAQKVTGLTALAQLSHAKIELSVHDVGTGEAHHSVPLRLHLRKADQGQPFGANNSSASYHFWINNVCVSNRSVSNSGKDLPYVKSVLPVFLMRAPTDDVMAVAKEAIQQQQNAVAAATKNSNIPKALIEGATQSNVAPESSPGSAAAMVAAAAGNATSKMGTINLATSDKFVISATIGVVRGLPGTGTFGFSCPTYKIVACPLAEDSSETGGFTEFLSFETGEVYPSVSGSLRWDSPLVFRRKQRERKPGSQPQQPPPRATAADATKATARSIGADLDDAAGSSAKEDAAGGAAAAASALPLSVPWQCCRIGLRLIEVPPQQTRGGSASSSSSMSSSAAGGGGGGNVIAEAILSICPPAPLSAVRCVMSQPLVFVVRPCFPRYDALKLTSWVARGTVIALANSV